MEDWFTPYETRPLPSAKRVLIFAPHPDDEIFGCGGAACLYREQGVEVTTVVVTDGAGNALATHRPAIFASRQAETNAALDTLNIPPAIFWGLQDRGIGTSPGLPTRMATLLETYPFDVVFTPSLCEIHPDHKACTHAMLAALEQRQLLGKTLPTVMFYEIGVPLQPNCLIDITPVWSRKQRAMQSFVSQQATQDYARQFEGLNTYRTYTLRQHIQYAEAYRLIPADTLWKETGRLSTDLNPHTSWHWCQTVMAAAEAGVEAMQTQLVAQNSLVANMDASARARQEELLQKVLQISAGFNEQISHISLERQNLQWQVDHQSQEIQSFKNHINQQKNQLDERADQLKALRWTTEHQATENTNLIQDLLHKQKQLDEYADQLKALSWTTEHQATENAHLIQDLLQKQKQLHNCQTELELMAKTLWWRVGKPLRWALRQLKSSKA
jgi:LmbE family N-acetylglucosaminyl deacetylase